MIESCAKEMKLSNSADLVKKTVQLQSDFKAAQATIEALENKIASFKLDSILGSAKDVNGLSVITAKTEGVTMDAVRNTCDNIKAQNPLSVTLIALVNGDRLNFVCSCGADAIKKGANAGKLVKIAATVCGGGGGGRPDSATAGGKDVSKIDEALEAVVVALGA